MDPFVFVLPAIAAGIVLYGVCRGVKVFDCFVEGAKSGVKTFVSLLPPLAGLLLGVTMLKASGALDVLTWLLGPVARATGIPAEVLPLAVLSPISGSGSLSMFETTLKTYGADTYIGRTASVMMGSSETTFYATTVYYGAVGITKTRHTIPAALCADITCFVVSALAVRMLF